MPIQEVVQHTLARIWGSSAATRACIRLLENDASELASAWSAQIISQTSKYGQYAAQDPNVKIQIERNSRSVISAYLPVLRSCNITALSGIIETIVGQRVELAFSLEEMLNVFFMFIGLIRRHTQRIDPTAIDGNATLQDVAEQLTLLTTVIVTEHYRKRTATAEPTEDVIGETVPVGETTSTVEAMKLSALEYRKLLGHYRTLGDTEVVVAIPNPHTRSAHADGDMR
jgi:hypothetical protein